MPNFFIPSVPSSEMERVYRSFEQSSLSDPLAQPVSRLFKIIFYDRQQPRSLAVAQVAEEMNWSGAQKNDPVLAIIETTNLICVFTQSTDGFSGAPILVSRKDVVGRVYFDDFSALGRIESDPHV